MRLSDFDFHLPQELIAQRTASPRDACRLMIVDRMKNTVADESFSHIAHFLKRGDVLVFNDSKVLPARLIGTKKSGGKAELLLVRQLSKNSWECMVGNIPPHRQVGATIRVAASFTGTIVHRGAHTATVRFNQSGHALMRAIMKHGRIPTPPYIKSKVKESEYQNVFADPKKLGSVAAPTAGLHFTKRLLARLKKKGVQIEFVTLHVGLGTFLPVKNEDIKKHKMHSEYFELDRITARRLNLAKREGRRIIPVGTTALRVLESCATAVRKPNTSHLSPLTSSTSIFIYPGYRFRFIDALITNFHTPRSTLLMLVTAFAGKKLITRAYAHAIKKKYRFYSLGDAMFIR